MTLTPISNDERVFSICFLWDSPFLEHPGLKGHALQRVRKIKQTQPQRKNIPLCDGDGEDDGDDDDGDDENNADDGGRDGGDGDGDRVDGDGGDDDDDDGDYGDGGD